MDPDSIVGSVLMIIILLLVNAFFAMSEIAIISVNQNRMKRLAEQGNKKAVKLLKITSEPSDFLATIQVGVTLSGLLSSAFAAERFAGIIVQKLDFIPISKDILSVASIIIITAVLSYFTLVFGELVPKRIAMNNADSVALKIVGFVTVFGKITRPFVRFLAISTNGILKLFNIKPENELPSVTEEDILMMVNQGEETGVIEESGGDMIKNIFDFDDMDVEDIMTHRTEIFAFEKKTPAAQAAILAAKEGYSRIPVYSETIDKIIGILHVKDLLGADLSDKTAEDFMREAYFVPDSKKCSRLLTELREQKIHMAVVVTEYGGTAGIVTMEDLLEEIVGSIQDEYDIEEEDEIVCLSENSYLFSGLAPVNDVEDIFGDDIFDNQDCDTIGGFVSDIMGKIPEENESIEIGGETKYKITPVEVSKTRIIKLKIERII